MESVPENEYLEFLPDTLEAVRRDINLEKPGEMKDAVRILNEWVHKQGHFLKKDFPPEYLETTIVMAKGSLERAKKQIDRICTARTLTPKYFEPYDIKKDFQPQRGINSIVMLPKQTKDHCRIFVAKFIGKLDPILLEGIYRCINSFLEYMKMYDYHKQTIVVYDVLEADLVHFMTNCNLIEIKNCYLTILETYGIRLKRVHLLTKSKLVYKIITFFKQFLKQKIVDRIVVNKSIEELQQYYPKEMLPKDYGGYEKTLDELQDGCLEELSSEKYKQHIKCMCEARVNEANRPSSDFLNLYAGISGTFRALTLD